MLEKLHETRRQDYFNTLSIQNRRKNYYDSKFIPKNLQPNDLVLLFDSHFKKILVNLKCNGLAHIKCLLLT